MKPIRDITLSTGKVIKHTIAENGSINALPAMTPSEHREYWTRRNYERHCASARREHDRREFESDAPDADRELDAWCLPGE